MDGSRSLQTRYRPRQYREFREESALLCIRIFPFHFHQICLHNHLTLLKDDAIPQLGPALRTMTEHLVSESKRGCGKALLSFAEVLSEYYRARFRREQPRESTSDMQLPRLTEEMEEGRRVYCEHPSVQWIQRSQTAQIYSGTLGGTSRLVRRRQGRDDIEMLWVEDVAGDERDRVCLLGRSEELMPYVCEFCKYKTSKQAILFSGPKKTTLA